MDKSRYIDTNTEDYTVNALQHFGIKGMKWGIRRTPEQLGHKEVSAGGGGGDLDEEELEEALKDIKKLSMSERMALYKKLHSKYNAIELVKMGKKNFDKLLASEYVKGKQEKQGKLERIVDRHNKSSKVNEMVKQEESEQESRRMNNPAYYKKKQEEKNRKFAQSKVSANKMAQQEAAEQESRAKNEKRLADIRKRKQSASAIAQQEAAEQEARKMNDPTYIRKKQQEELRKKQNVNKMAQQEAAEQAARNDNDRKMAGYNYQTGVVKQKQSNYVNKAITKWAGLPEKEQDKVTESLNKKFKEKYGKNAKWSDHRKEYNKMWADEYNAYEKQSKRKQSASAIAKQEEQERLNRYYDNDREGINKKHQLDTQKRNAANAIARQNQNELDEIDKNNKQQLKSNLISNYEKERENRRRAAIYDADRQNAAEVNSRDEIEKERLETERTRNKMYNQALQKENHDNQHKKVEQMVKEEALEREDAEMGRQNFNKDIGPDPNYMKDVIAREAERSARWQEYTKHNSDIAADYKVAMKNGDYKQAIKLAENYSGDIDIQQRMYDAAKKMDRNHGLTDEELEAIKMGKPLPKDSKFRHGARKYVIIRNR